MPSRLDRPADKARDFDTVGNALIHEIGCTGTEAWGIANWTLQPGATVREWFEATMRKVEHDAERWADAIARRMTADHARDLSDDEITRTLDPCVQGHRLVVAAKWLRTQGRLEMTQRPDGAVAVNCMAG